MMTRLVELPTEQNAGIILLFLKASLGLGETFR